MYKTIENNKDFDDFLHGVNYLHDAILREFNFMSRGYVDSDRNMHGDVEPSDARVLFQIQSVETPCVEIIFESVFEVRISPDVLIRPTGQVSDGKITFYIGGYQQGDQTKVISKKMKYRVLDEKCLGCKLNTMSEIAVGEIKKAFFVEENFFQCPECADIWEIKSVDEKISRCPGCGTLLEIIPSVPDR